jgi:hypothetical protein
MDCKKWQKGKTMVAENDGNKHIIEQRERELIGMDDENTRKPK